MFQIHNTWCHNFLDTRKSPKRVYANIGVNFYKAARLEPPTFQTPRLSSFWEGKGHEPPHYLEEVYAYVCKNNETILQVE